MGTDSSLGGTEWYKFEKALESLESFELPSGKLT